jgi:hypothetical protein
VPNLSILATFAMLALPVIANAAPRYVKSYPQIEQWSVLMFPSAENPPLPVCMAIVQEQDAGTYKYGLSISVRVSSTSLILNLAGVQMPAPPIVRLFLDHRLFGSLDVESTHVLDNPTGELIVAMLPDSMLAKQLLPIMIRSSTLTVAAGTMTYVFPMKGFVHAANEIAHCAVDAQQEMRSGH